MRDLKECEELTNPQLLVEIGNRNTLIQGMPNNSKAMRYVTEVDKLWKMMERNGHKK